MSSEQSRISAPGLPTWTSTCVWWQVYPLGATGAPVRPEPGAPLVEPGAAPRLDRLEPWLDYAVELGANGLSLGPIFASSTHGYDTTDHFQIDPRLGDDAAFDRLARSCRDRGLALMLDGVLNHVGAQHPLLRAALEGGHEREMFRLEGAGQDAVGPGAAEGPGYVTFEGHESLAVLNHDSQQVVDLAVRVLSHWLDRGASAWRLDAAYAVPPAFWARVLPRVRENHPQAWFMGEVIHGDYPGTVTESTMDSVTQYELWKAVWSSINDANFYELDWCLRRHNEMLDSFTPATFVGNHDVTRIASRVGEGGAALAAVILMTVGGVPSVYYGDEQAFRGVKTETLGGDDAVRPALPEQPSGLSAAGQWMYRLHQDLIGVRRRHPWLVRARTEVTSLDNPVLAYDAVGQDGQRLGVSLALEPRPRAEVRAPGEEVLVVEAPR
ncbi:alpha-amylase [Actinomyces lilanjuaniae]|uniref:Alpha-amylase n=1 Tax=Actinomyces lilanjuaniae TaxID=2321394 RepID=A0ABM6Z1K2_9ACTO|nr:alpha-amylase family protein [Actinomyces lilanjuaniae]AYD88972.1 alpha-amylase [Actinomyces lilanjuaniae]